MKSKCEMALEYLVSAKDLIRDAATIGEGQKRELCVLRNRVRELEAALNDSRKERKE